MTQRKKERAKELDQEAWLNNAISQKDNMPERQGPVFLEKKIVLRVATTKEEIVAMIESVIIGISRIVHTFTRKRRIDLPVQKEKEKETSPKKKR